MTIAVPAVSSTLLDGGIGIVAASLANVHWKVGTCSSGVAGTTYPFSGTDPNNVKTTLGKGPLVDATIDALIRSGGKTVYARKPTTVSTAGVAGAVTSSGTSPPVITLTGTPYNDAVNKIRIVTAGARGTFTFQHSTDNGNTWSSAYTSAATVLLSNGVTANIANTAASLDNTWTWNDSAPALTSSDMSAELDAIIASPYVARWVHFVGQPTDAATLATIATMVDGKMTTAYAAKKPMWALLEGPPVDKATMATAFASFVSNFVSIVGGFCDYTNLNGGTLDKVSAGRPVSGRIALNPLGVHHSRLPNDSDLSPLPGIVRLVPDGALASSGYNDENATPGLNAARITSLGSIPGVAGFYPKNTLTMASTTSDYQQLPLLQIALEVVSLYNAWAASNLSVRLRKNLATGYILPSVADALNDDASDYILTGLKSGNPNGSPVDGLRVIVNRADNLSADPTLRGKIRIVGPAFASAISFDIGFATSLS